LSALTKSYAKLDDQREQLAIKLETLQTTLKNRMIESANFQRQIEDQLAVIKRQNFEIKELKSMIDLERKGKEAAIDAAEADHKQKYDQLK
jgi:hypothetical protein